MRYLLSTKTLAPAWEAAAWLSQSMAVTQEPSTGHGS